MLLNSFYSLHTFIFSRKYDWIAHIFFFFLNNPPHSSVEHDTDQTICRCFCFISNLRGIFFFFFLLFLPFSSFFTFPYISSQVAFVTFSSPNPLFCSLYSQAFICTIHIVPFCPCQALLSFYTISDDIWMNTFEEWLLAVIQIKSSTSILLSCTVYFHIKEAQSTHCLCNTTLNESEA